MEFLNLGCGSTFHNDWVNVNFYKTGKEVIPHNLLKGIPFPDSSFDIVYHSHLLEHFTKQSGKELIHECFRVLKPGGIIRIAVPDLETITKEYLRNLYRAMNNDPLAEFDYEWIVLELLDQMTRTHPGGEMGKYLKNKISYNQKYIWERIGSESKTENEISSENTNRKLLSTFLKKIIQSPISTLSKSWFYFLEKISPVIRTGKFRLSGEVHQWMYDRYSLSKLLMECGFKEIEIKSALTSNIPNWNNYQLDNCDGQIRKPDSLFVEAKK